MKKSNFTKEQIAYAVVQPEISAKVSSIFRKGRIEAFQRELPVIIQLDNGDEFISKAR